MILGDLTVQGSIVEKLDVVFYGDMDRAVLKTLEM